MQNDGEQVEEWNSVLPETQPIVCQLANGHAIKIAAGLWSRWRTYEEWAFRLTPQPYFAIRIYCTEDTLPKRLAWVEEFCEESDFSGHAFDEIWQWLAELSNGRAIFDFDSVHELLDYISDGIIELSVSDVDAVDHLRRLPQISDPDAFDKVDDSIFNDQNDRVDG